MDVRVCVCVCPRVCVCLNACCVLDFHTNNGRAIVDEGMTLLFTRHPYILSFFGIWDLPCDMLTRTFLVLEYCEFQVRLLRGWSLVC